MEQIRFAGILCDRFCRMGAWSSQVRRRSCQIQGRAFISEVVSGTVVFPQMHTLESCQAGVGSNSAVCSREPLFSRELLLLSRFAHCCAQPGRPKVRPAAKLFTKMLNFNRLVLCTDLSPKGLSCGHGFVAPK